MNLWLLIVFVFLIDLVLLAAGPTAPRSEILKERDRG
jgi:hypothetical protein